MSLIPSSDEVVALLRRTGALRSGHFQYPNGLHSDQYLQVPLAMQRYGDAKMLGVALSRLLRGNPEIRASISEVSIVTPATGGLPVAYTVCEALGANKVYWSEGYNDGRPQRFRQYFEVEKGEKVILVDDILRTGTKLNNLRALLAPAGAEIIGLAVVVYQPTPETPDFSPLPLYSLAQLDGMYYTSAEDCSLCKQGMPAETVWI